MLIVLFATASGVALVALLSRRKAPRDWEGQELGLVATVLFGVLAIVATMVFSDTSSDSPTPTEYDRLKMLRTDIQLSVFNSAMGMEPMICRSKGVARSCIYERPSHFVQVIVDKDNQVRSFAVTSRDPDFNPEIKFFESKIQLGKTTISEAMGMIRTDNLPDKLRGWGGATGHYQYLEAIDGAHILNFQEYAVGVTDVGSGDGPWADVVDWFATANVSNWRRYADIDESVQSEVFQEFRRVTRIDTVVITAPWVKVESLPEIAATRDTVAG